MKIVWVAVQSRKVLFIRSCSTVKKELLDLFKTTKSEQPIASRFKRKDWKFSWFKEAFKIR